MKSCSRMKSPHRNWACRHYGGKAERAADAGITKVDRALEQALSRRSGRNNGGIEGCGSRIRLNFSNRNDRVKQNAA